jgi:trimeric autotransporter adhesin
MPTINGTSGGDTLNGTIGDDTINGLDGNDVINGLDGNDVIDGGLGDDSLFSGLGDDTIVGGPGNDHLEGGPGIDLVSGGAGDDVYLVGSLDTLIENPGEGTDEVLAGFDYTLPANFENLTLTEAGAINGTGNSSDNLINGNRGANTILGLEGHDQVNGLGGDDHIDGGLGEDTLDGGSGNDTLGGGDENDTLIGGSGDDTLIGGAGDDTYSVDSPGDVVVEDATGDYDTVLSWISYTLSDTVEALVLVSPDAISGTGNASNNLLIGSTASNDLHGLAGDDRLEGGLGDDDLDGGDGWDELIGGEGADILDGGADNDLLISSDQGVPPDFHPWAALDVGAEVDTLVGGEGSDRLIAGYSDIIDGGAGFDYLHLNLQGGSSGIVADFRSSTLTIGGGLISGIENLVWLLGTEFDDQLTVGTPFTEYLGGGGGNDVLDARPNSAPNSETHVEGGDGDDTIYLNESAQQWAFGGAGNDTIYGGGVVIHGDDGNDIIIRQSTVAGVAVGDAGDDRITGSGVQDELHGGSGADLISGGNGNDWLYGEEDSDIIMGGTGNDQIDGGDGFDIASYADATSGVTVNLALAGSAQNTGGAGIDTLISIEDLTGSGLADTLTGDAATNMIRGGDGDDILDGGAAADVMFGGLGNDRFYVDDPVETIVELAGEGDDLAYVLGTYTLVQGVSVETLVALNQSSTDSLVLTGNEFGQSLYGNLGDNYLNGGAGNDYLVGLDGNDGLLGGAGADNMAGGQGNDVYYVDAAGDQLFEAANEGDDRVVATASYALTAGAAVEALVAEQTSANINLTGNEFGQSIYGNAGNNILTGLGGADYLVGGAGNDSFYVDQSDFISELAGGGDDLLFVTDHYFLQDGIAVETLVAANQDSLASLDLGGNEHGQSLYGSQGSNALNGGGGNDYLVGLGGNDFLVGGEGNDNLAGGTGNDIYYVDSGDWVIEAAGEGDDRAVALTSFALRPGESVETLVAAEGIASINLTGNALAQSLYGNAGVNVLTTGGGADYLVGGGGNDTFVLSSSAAISTIADYASGDVVDVSQLLSVAAGTDVTGGGYLRITAAGQLQVDANGGGDAFVTIANVSGSGAVAVRYLAGGSSTDLSVARSGQSMAATDVSATADLKGHGLDDMLGRSDRGLPSDWLAGASAGVASQDAHALTPWHVQPQPEWLI